MSSQRYQTRGQSNRTALITVRVTPDELERLHRLAEERGETLSRMLLTPWLADRGPARRRAGRAVKAVEAVASSESARAAARLAVARVKRPGGVRVTVGEGSALGEVMLVSPTGRKLALRASVVYETRGTGSRGLRTVAVRATGRACGGGKPAWVGAVVRAWVGLGGRWRRGGGRRLEPVSRSAAAAARSTGERAA